MNLTKHAHSIPRDQRLMNRIGMFLVLGMFQSAAIAQNQLENTNANVIPVNYVGEGHVDLSPCFTNLVSDVEVPAPEDGPLVLRWRLGDGLRWR